MNYAVLTVVDDGADLSALYVGADLYDCETEGVVTIDDLAEAANGVPVRIDRLTCALDFTEGAPAVLRLCREYEVL